MKRFFIFLLLCFPLFAHAMVEGELLEPEQAFKFSARMQDANTIEVRYQIADGYYLYREKFKFETTSTETTLGAAQLPAGKVKQDEYFGRVETYRHDVKITLPLKRTNPAAQEVTLKAVSQGCADAGVCYPPVEQKIVLKLAAIPSAPEASSSLATLKQFGSSLGGASIDFLPPEIAFTLDVKVKDDHTLLANFKPAASYYLYRDKISFSLKNAAGVTISKVVLPAGDIKTDPNFGKTEVYHQPFQATIDLKRDTPQAANLILAASFQGCSEKGVCYPPISKTFKLSLAGNPPETKTLASSQPAPEAPVPTATETPVVPLASTDQPQSESSRIEDLFKGGNFWLIISAFFGAGLLLALTPCVFPMIPILSGIIAGQGQHLTKGRAFVLSLSYVLGMAITYALVGIAAGLSGSLLSAALQNPWVLGTFAMVFVILAFSMFGFYELQLPSAIQSKFSNASNQMKGGSTVGVFVMGALSAVIVGPCVAAPLAGALLYIGQTHNVILGGSALFAMALGMGVPLILVGVSAGTLLPKAGGWMNAVKSFFGVLLLGVAIWLISPVIPDVLHMLLWAALLIVSAIYLKAIDPLPPTAHGFSKFWKGVGMIALIAGISLLIGALSGSRDILQPLGGFRTSTAAGMPGSTQAEHLKFERVKTVAELEARIKQANGKHVMLDFYADWCVSCKEFERFTFSDPRVVSKLKDAVLIQADLTANSDADKALLKKFSLFGPPGIIFFDKKGDEVKAARTIGYTAPDAFLKNLDTALR